MNAKLTLSKKEGLFEYQSDVRILHEKMRFMKIMNADPVIADLIADPNYPFTQQQLYHLSKEEYALIQNNKMARIFLLAGFRVNELDPAMSRMLASMAAQVPLNPLDHQDTLDVDGVIKLAESAKKNIGLDNLKQLLRFSYGQENFKINDLIWALRTANIITCRAPETLAVFFDMLRMKHSPYDIAIKESRKLYIRAGLESNAQIPYSEVYASYKKPSVDIKSALMPTDAALQDSIKNFEAVDECSVRIKAIGYSDSSLKFLLERTVENYRKASTIDEKKELEPYIWAALREFLERTTAISLHSNQIINAHLILNTPLQKTVAQIKAGEGQPELQAILMAFCALTTGKKQYHVSGSVYLAEADVAKFEAFYRQVGLNCTCNVSSAPHDNDILKMDSYLGNVVYGTADAFRVGYLWLMKSGLNDYFNPAEITLHVSDVALLLKNAERHLTQLGSTGSTTKEYETTRLYHDIWQYIWSHRATGHQPATYHLDGFIAYLIEQHYFTPADVTSALNRFTLNQWYENAIAALSLEKEVHYQIKPSVYDDKLRIVANGTSGDEELSGGLQQIISARESLPVPKQRKVAAFILHNHFFNLFSNMFVVTHSIGEKSCEDYLTKMYPGTTLLNLPQYRTSKAVFIGHTICNGKDAQYRQLISDIHQARIQGQPLLLLFKTIREAHDFYAYANSNGQPVDSSTDEAVRSFSSFGAGLAGSVTCSTFDACRFDIMPTAETEAKGGLGVFLCSPPQNERDIALHFSRTGQQGRNGFFGFRLERGALLQRISQLDGYIDDDVTELQPSDDINTTNPILALNSRGVAEALERENLTRAAALVSRLESRYPYRNEQLFELWVEKMREKEKSINDADIHYASYTDMVFALQKLVYDSHDPKLVLVFGQYLGMIQENMEQAYRDQSAFFPELSDILLEMIKRAELDTNALYSLARKTNNAWMMRCLGKIQDTPVSMDTAVSAGLTFFTSPSFASSASASEQLSPDGASPGN